MIVSNCTNMVIYILQLSIFITVAATASLQISLQRLSKLWQYQTEEAWLDFSRPGSEQRPIVLPMYDTDPLQRANHISKKQEGFLYGPCLLGNSSYFPTGYLGDALVQQHQDLWYSDAYWLTQKVSNEMASAATSLKRAGGLRTPLDYRHLYDNQWKDSVPLGVAVGAFENYTSDLLFAMERLSVNPYTISRLNPRTENLPFNVSDEIVTQLTDMSLEDLHQQGRIFYADHGYQADYAVSPGRHSAACSAYFYIHPKSQEFLPLAIKTNVGADLTYTPLDKKADWLLAKAMFNMNDLFHGQIFHLINSHAVSEIVYLAAIRTLSDRHPILVLLNRLMHQAYAIRPVGETVLFNPGGFFDQSFAITSQGVRQFASDFWPKDAGPFIANYFSEDLARRGIINSTFGPALRSIPFFEDANVIYSSIKRFMTSFVGAYYTNSSVLSSDYELQSWIREATENASIIDFPPWPITEETTLIDILTHVAFLSVSHHVLNSGQPFATSGVLPLHPSALYAPVPVEKGVEDIMQFLPPATKAAEHIALLARFNRPQLATSNGVLKFMFSSKDLLRHSDRKVAEAAITFQREMEDFSTIVQSRTFDPDGLCQGMPFVWKGLDPATIPFFLSV